MIGRLVTVAVSVVLAVPAAAAATWSDAPAVRAGVLSAATLPPPTVACRSRVLGGITFSWPPVAGATGYTFFATSTAPGEYLTETSKALVSLAGGGTATVVAHRDFGSTTWTSKRSNGIEWGSLVVSGC